ncbi:MAG: phage tail tape measure protein [Candidatus Pacebacteria bacterium]|nr:phage tail tape measure protein [Candidatus Paceibacterota bacterium]
MDNKISILIKAILEKKSKEQMMGEIKTIQDEINKTPLKFKIDIDNEEFRKFSSSINELANKVGINFDKLSKQSVSTKFVDNIEKSRIEVGKLEDAYGNLIAVSNKYLNGEKIKPSETKVDVSVDPKKEQNQLAKEQLEFENKISEIQNKNYVEAKSHLTQIKKLRESYHNINNKDTEEAKETLKQLSQHQAQYNNIIKRKIDIGEQTKIEGIEAGKLNQLEKTREQILRNIDIIKSKNTDKQTTEIYQQTLAQEKLLESIRKMRGVDGKFIVKDNLKDLDALEASIRKLEPGSKNFARNIEDGNFKLKKITNTTSIYKKKVQEASKFTGIFGQSIFDAGRKFVTWLVVGDIIIGTIRQIKNSISYINELDKNLTNIRIVTGATADEMERLARNYNELAKELGATTNQLLTGATEWFRQGKTADKTQKLLTATIVESKLAGIGSAQATEYLTAVLNGYKMEAESAISVVDKLVAVDNDAATSVAELSVALQRSSNSASQAGVGLSRLVGYIGAVSSVTRKSASTIGESFKTMFARMQNLKSGKIDEEGVAFSDVENALARVGVVLRKDKDTFRDMGSVLDDISAKWNTLTNVEQSNIANAIAGKILCLSM